MNVLDMSLFSLINAGAGTPAWRIHCAAFVSNVLPAATVLAIALLALARPERRQTLWVALASMLVTWIAVTAFRTWLPLPRPGALEVGIQWVSHSDRGSFPSLHAAGSFAVAMAYLLERRDRWALMLVVAAAAIAGSRVYLGLHFPTDVMAGALVGSLAALSAHRVATWRRRAPAEPRAKRVLT